MSENGRLVATFEARCFLVRVCDHIFLADRQAIQYLVKRVDKSRMREDKIVDVATLRAIPVQPYNDMRS